MAGSFRNRKLWIARSSIMKKQPSWDTALADVDIDTLLRQNTPAFPNVNENYEDDMDCGGEYAFARQLTSRLWQFNLGFYGTVKEMAAWLALCLGADTPTGSQANEVQTATDANIDGGSAPISLVIDGRTYTTAAVAWDALAAVWQAALQAVLGTGNATVTGTLATGLVVTYAGDLARYDLPLATFGAGFTDGGSPITPTFVQTTPGSNYSHSLTTNGTSDQGPQTSLIYGFDGDSTLPLKAKNIVGASWKVSGQVRQKVLCEVQLYGSGETADVSGYSKPACDNSPHLRVADTHVKIGSTFYGAQSFSLEFNNNLLINDDPYTTADIDCTRLERGDRKTTANLTVFGSRGDTLATLVESNTESAFELILGKPKDRLRCLAPAMHLQKANPFTSFSGEANRSTINIDGEAFLSGDSGSPFNAIALIDQSTAFLTT